MVKVNSMKGVSIKVNADRAAEFACKSFTNFDNFKDKPVDCIIEGCSMQFKKKEDFLTHIEVVHGQNKQKEENKVPIPSKRYVGFNILYKSS